MKKALVVIDIQNDITKHYRDIVEKINDAIDWAVASEMHVAYIKHNNLSAATRTFKPGTHGEELAPELKIVSDNIFVKTKSNALTSEAFATFIEENGIDEFYIVGADATVCVKSTCFNMVKSGYKVHVLSDCITSYDLTKLPEMLAYYANKGCDVKPFAKPMTLRPYIKTDAPIILSWIKDRTAFRKWCADRLPAYPPRPEDMDALYAAAVDVFPFTAIEEDGKVVGHLMLRRPDASHAVIRFGFVIVDVQLRGRGYGRRMLQLAIRKAIDEFGAGKITLGVFDNNPAALRCYESVGFEVIGTDTYCIDKGDWTGKEMEIRATPSAGASPAQDASAG